MKKIGSICLSMLLLACLLVGCTAPDENSGLENDNRNTESQSDVMAENWRQAYYEIAVQAMEQNPEAKIEHVSLYYTKEGAPYFSITLLKKDSVEESLWYFEDNKVEELYSGRYFIEGVREKTRNPITSMGSETGYTVYEIVNGEFVELLRDEVVENTTRVLYSYEDDTSWTYEQLRELGPVEDRLGIIFAGDSLWLTGGKYMINNAVRKQMLAEYLLQSYQPDIPKEAPAWVSRYVQYFHSTMYIAQLPSYTEMDKVKMQEEYGLGSISLLGGVYENDSPILVTGGYYELMQPAFYILGAQGFYTSTGDMSISHTFYQDEQGDMVVNRHYLGENHWYALQVDRMQWLLEDGREMGSLTCYSGGEEQTFANEAEAEIWLQQKREEKLEQLSFALPLTEMSLTSYELPKEATWEEWEAALIEALCSYAKEIGQWG